MRKLNTHISYAIIIFMLLQITAFKRTDMKESSIVKNKLTNPITNIVDKPSIQGKVVYHSYSCYGCDGTKMYIYNFTTNQLSCISQNWNIDYPINAHFNDNASKIVFMGQPVGSGDWDIYIWTVGSSSAPINLTAGNGLRDEDPKFSPNGYRVAFKQNNDLKIIEISSGIITDVTKTTSTEEGMPYYTTDGTTLLYAKGAESSSDIFKISTSGTGNKSLATVTGVQEYYPILRNATTFLYTRWYSASNQTDQVYLGYFANSTRTRLPFNNSNADYSDAFPCGTDYVILSTNKAGGSGAYDLSIANINTGQIWSLSKYNTQINTEDNELGACFY